MLKNLAFRTTESLFGSPNLICIDRALFTELYDRHCNMHPKPRYLWVERAEIEKLGEDRQLSRLVDHQNHIIKADRKMMEKIDDEILEELDGTGIEAYRLESDVPSKKPLLFGVRATGEVPYSIYGTLRHFTATRAWTYWIIRGDVPNELARIIYDDRLGKAFIRTNGYAGNEDPDRFLKVDHYHIDSKAGLTRFAELVNQFYDNKKLVKRQKI